MPYIEDQAVRDALDVNAKSSLRWIHNPGDLNYAITTLLIQYTKRLGKKYLTIVIVMGTLLCVALEYYRRLAAKYEDEKIQTNGDLQW